MSTLNSSIAAFELTKDNGTLYTDAGIEARDFLQDHSVETAPDGQVSQYRLPVNMCPFESFEAVTTDTLPQCLPLLTVNVLYAGTLWQLTESL